MTELDNLSITGKPGEVEVLGPASDHLDSPSWLNMGGADLAPPYDSYLAKDSYPLPTAADREGYHGVRHLDYWLSGLRDHVLLRDRLAERGLSIGAEEAVFELGSASGRVSRHFWCQGGHEDMWCADINARHVEWIRRFLPPKIKVFQNTILPHVPIADNSIGLVYAFSVFTHLDAYELSWLAELHRFLRPGGVAYLTAHTERTWNRLSPEIKLYDKVLQMKKPGGSGLQFTEEDLAGPMPVDRLVVGANQVYGTNVFRSTDYLRQTWGRFFDVVDIIDAGCEYQDVVILKNR